VVPLFGGRAIDWKGPRIVMIITAILCVIGQGIFSVGGLTNIWILMLVGRFVFGIGG
jgi:MFS family permease